MKTYSMFQLAVAHLAAVLLLARHATGGEITIHATDGGNGRFSEFVDKDLYPKFEIGLMPKGAGGAIDKDNFNKFGTLKLADPQNNGGKLEWFNNGVPDGYMLVPAVIPNPFNTPELRFKPKTSGDLKQNTKDEIMKALEKYDAEKAARLLADMEDIVDKVHSTVSTAPGQTDLFYLALLKDVATEVNLKHPVKPNDDWSKFATSTVVKLIHHASNYSTQNCYTYIGQGLGLWLEIHDAFCLKGKGSKAWGGKLVKDVAAFRSPSTQQLFESELIDIIGNLQNNLRLTAAMDEGLKSRIKKNLEGEKVEAEIKRRLMLVQDCLDLDLDEDEDLEKLKSKTLIEVEEMIDVLEDRLTPKRG